MSRMFHKEAFEEFTAIQNRGEPGRADRTFALSHCLRILTDVWAGKISLNALEKHPLPHRTYPDLGVKLFVTEAAPDSIVVLAVVGATSDRKLVLAMEEWLYGLDTVIWKDHRTKALGRAGNRAKDI